MPPYPHAQNGISTQRRALISGSGEMANFVRHFDWNATSLGPVAGWSETLLGAVNLVLSAVAPMQLFWGPEMVLIYNDGLAPFMAGKHPHVVGKPGQEAWQEAWPLVGAQLEAVLREGKAVSFTNVLIPILRNGVLEDVFWSYSYSPIYGPEGEVHGILNVAQDTTAAVLAQQQLRASEDRAVRILQSIGDAVIVTDADAKVGRMNPIAETLTGWTEAEALGLPLSTVFHIVNEEDRRRVEDPVDKVTRLGGVVGLANHTILIGKEGAETHIDDSGAPIRDENGNLTGIVLVFRNIDERRAAERERDAVTERLNQVLEVTKDSIIGIDREWRITYMNPQSRRDAAPMADAVGRNFWTSFPAAVYEGSPYVEHCYRAMEQGKGGEFEAFYPAPLSIWIQVEVQPTSEGIALFFRNITGQKQIDEKLKSDEEKQVLLLGLMQQQRESIHPESMMLAASEVIGRYLNVAQCGFFEMRDADTIDFTTGWATGALPLLRGAGPVYFLGPKIIEIARAGTAITLADAGTDPIAAGSTLERIGMRSFMGAPILRYGQWHAGFYTSHTEPRTWTDDEVSFLRQTADLTWASVERARAQGAVRTSEERFRAVFREAPIGICLTTLDGQFLACNPVYERLTGRTEEELRGMSFFDLVHPEDIPANKESLQKLVTMAISGFVLEQRYLHADGTALWVRTHATSLRDEAGRPYQMLGLLEDINARKLAESALMQTEKLAAVGRLAASIAHEINNPLESVTNLLYLARHSQETGQVQDYLETAERELRRVSVISNQTLRFYRQSSNARPVTCEELFDSVLSIYQGRIVNSHVQVEKRKRAKQLIQCFDGEIRQVLNNLVGNAIDAMHPEGGRLLIRSRETARGKTGQKGIVLTVADTGVGISPHVQKKVFEAFYTTKGIGGTGLGLWVSKEIVERHNGALRFRSSEKQGFHGTVFTLFLPFEAVSR